MLTQQQAADGEFYRSVMKGLEPASLVTPDFGKLDRDAVKLAMAEFSGRIDDARVLAAVPAAATAALALLEKLLDLSADIGGKH
jgi:hypothetical protein